MTLLHRGQYYFQFFIEILFCKTRIKRIFIPKFTENEIRYYRFKNFKALQENSKITNIELSKIVGLSAAPTLGRVQKLEKLGIISSYHAKK